MTEPIPLTELTVVPESRSKPISRREVRFLCRLGQGGMAEVHLADAAPLGAPPRLIVVKRMHQQHVDDPSTVRMFLDEARLALCLTHPNIVRSERLGVFEGRHGIVMEFLEGQPLHQVLRRAYETEASLSLDFIAQVAIAALDGLHYAHELRDVVGNPLRLVHRDVSPQNLFVTYDGAVKLLDFGIAKNSMQDGRTRTGLLKGKISYMAPEQARGEELDRRADLWSLGVVLWEAVTGNRLFKGNNEAATLHLTLSEAIQPPSERRPEVPSELEAILMRALERDPARRYATAAEMRDAIEGWLSTRELNQDASVTLVMRRLFARDMREQRQQVEALLNAHPEPIPQTGMTLVAPLIGQTATLSGSLRGTQVSSVTDLMNELTRQRRVTTRLLGGLLALVAVALTFGVYWALVLRPEQTRAARTLDGSVPRAAVPAAMVPVPAPSVVEPEPTPSSEPSRASAQSTHVRTSPVNAAWSAAKHGRLASAALAVVEPPPPSSPPPPSVTLETGLLNLDTSPWSIVSVGGRVLGQTPLIGVALPVGTHTLVLSNAEQGLKTTYQVTISAGKTTARRIGLD